MAVKTVLVSLLLGLLFYTPVHAQAKPDLSILLTHCEQKAMSRKPKAEHMHQKLFFPVRFLFGAYRHIVSEQVSADCAFDLTCSRFSIAAIRRFGIIKGTFLTADRLTRCHTFVGLETVPLRFNNFSGKVTDEPDMY